MYSNFSIPRADSENYFGVPWSTDKFDYQLSGCFAVMCLVVICLHRELSVNVKLFYFYMYM